VPAEQLQDPRIRHDIELPKLAQRHKREVAIRDIAQVIGCELIEVVERAAMNVVDDPVTAPHVKEELVIGRVGERTNTCSVE
jgi:hypothetical protein